jgi:hypothetical protein
MSEYIGRLQAEIARRQAHIDALAGNPWSLLLVEPTRLCSERGRDWKWRRAYQANDLPSTAPASRAVAADPRVVRPEGNLPFVRCSCDSFLVRWREPSRQSGLSDGAGLIRRLLRCRKSAPDGVQPLSVARRPLA